MLLGFKERFVPMILDGSKTHTIRAKRAIAPRVGETCHCYTGLRQKGALLLGRWECVRVEDIEIQAHEIRIAGQALSPDERNMLAWADGFRSKGRHRAFEEMMEFWDGRLPFQGDVIHWRYKR